MDILDVLLQEITAKRHMLLNKLGSGSIKDYAEYRYVRGIVAGITSMQEYIEELKQRLDNDYEE